MDTALNFLSFRPNRAVPSEVRSLQLSLNIDAGYKSIHGAVPARPLLPWHATLDGWLRLRDQLPELESLRHLSIWLDAGSQDARGKLISLKEPLDLDARIVPFAKLSLPMAEPNLGRYAGGNFAPVEFQPRLYTVVARDDSNYWQEPSICASYHMVSSVRPTSHV